MSWIWPDHVPRELPITAQERKAIHRDAWRLWWANKWNLVLYLTLPCIYLLTVFHASDAGGGLATWIGAGGWVHRLFRAGAPFVLFAICFAGGGAVLQRLRFAPCVYRALRDHGYDVCTRCGYWLRGLGDDIPRCPECGTPRA